LDQPFPEETETDSSILIDPEKTSPETEAPLTPEEEALVEIAAEALWNELGDLPDRAHFRADISYGANGNTNIYVDFELYIGDYRTWESYDVTLNANHEVTRIDGGYHNYRQYLKGATPDRIAAAEEGLDGQTARYGDKHSGYYLTVDDEGYLCLTCEVIVDKAFGDHEHKFFTERICKPES
jgi:hypothetical protein